MQLYNPQKIQKWIALHKTTKGNILIKYIRCTWWQVFETLFTIFSSCEHSILIFKQEQQAYMKSSETPYNPLSCQKLSNTQLARACPHQPLTAHASLQFPKFPKVVLAWNR